MCGRFSEFYTWQELHALYELSEPPASNLEPRYNLAPTEQADVILRDEGGARRYAQMRWGLVPWWWKKPLKQVPATFNARAETVASTPMFRDAFQRGRCLIPASGFFEWTGEKAARQPWFISATDGGLLTFAGLYDRWKNPETGERVVSCTIIVTEPNDFMRPIHNRMPVILAKQDWSRWLAEPAAALLRPAPEGTLHAWRVTPKMNSAVYKEAEGVAAVEEPV